MTHVRTDSLHPSAFILCCPCQDKYFEWLIDQGMEEKAGEMREKDHRYSSPQEHSYL